MRTTFASLGNTFRNSKWSDLKVQNIKPTFIVNYLTWAFGGALGLLACLSILSGSDWVAGLPGWSLIAQPLNDLSVMWERLLYTLTETWVQAWLSAYAFKVAWLNRLGLANISLYEPKKLIDYRPSKQPDLKLKLRGITYLAPNLTYPMAQIEATYHLHKTIQSVVYASMDMRPFFKSRTTYNPLLHKIDTLLPESINAYTSETFDWRAASISSVTDSYELTPSVITDWTGAPLAYAADLQHLTYAKSYTLNLNTVQQLNDFTHISSLSNFNVYSNLSQAKQDRWLLRNSLLSNSSIVDANSYTQAKKVLGSTSLDSNSTSTNIWSSSRVSNLSKFAELQHLSHLQNPVKFQADAEKLRLVLSSPADLQSFNFFETSRMWTTKKYFFFNQLQSNTVTLLLGIDDSNVESSPNNWKALNLFASLNDQNVALQLNDLNHVISCQQKLLDNTNSISSANSNYTGFGDADVLDSLYVRVLSQVDSSRFSTNSLGVFPTIPTVKTRTLTPHCKLVFKNNIK
jgi:hypothetical protein